MSRLMSVDVECVANGRGHNDRCVAHVAVVDGESEEVVLDVKIRQTEEVFSYLEPITGLTAADFNESNPDNNIISMDELHVILKDILGDDVLLVGQGIDSDINWLSLRQGVHFEEKRDLAQDFKAFNPKYGRYNFHSLQATAETLLGVNMAGSHNPAIDAIVSIQLYKKFVRPGNKRTMKEAHKKLIRTRNRPSVAKQLDYQCDGVCMAKFFKKKCICGQH
eukprot:m.29851 g.29851  ORF g.29851 m.29851 type:complete len:221 (+) comp9605_c0_seq1:126-788(+)